MDKSLPIVAIIGRANVGKSTLFNRLVGKRHAIISAKANTTRDPLYTAITKNKKNFFLVDTAGLTSEKGVIIDKAIDQLKSVKDLADLFVILIDGTTPVSDDDRKAIKLALRAKKPTLLAINKSDKQKLIREDSEYRKLGIRDVFNISAINGSGVDDLSDSIIKKLPTKKLQETSKIKVSIIGKPNVGKSTLINKLSDRKVSIVTEQAGTTRDVNYADVKFDNKVIQFADTAGLRKKSKLVDEIEYYSSVRVLQAIDEADICLLLVDMGQDISHQDQSIAGIIKDSGRALIIVSTKADLTDEITKKEYTYNLKYNMKFISWAALVAISAKSGQNLTKLKQLIIDIYRKQNTQIPTPKLNRLLQDAILERPPSGMKSIKPKLNYITQTGNNPLEFSIYCSHPGYIHFSYKRYLENMIRKEYDLVGVNIKLIFKKKHETNSRSRKSG